MIGGGYYVVANEWNWNMVLMSFIYSLGATSVIMGKHIDKYEDDKAKGIHTLPVIIGNHTALVVLISLYWYFTRIMKIYLSEKPKECPDNYLRTVRPLWYVAFAFDHNKKFGYLFIIGLLFEVIFKLI